MTAAAAHAQQLTSLQHQQRSDVTTWISGSMRNNARADKIVNYTRTINEPNLCIHASII